MFYVFIACTVLNIVLCGCVCVTYLQIAGGLTSGYSTHTLNTGYKYGTIKHHECHKTTEKRIPPTHARKISHTDRQR